MIATKTQSAERVEQVKIADIGFEQKYYPRAAGAADWVTVLRYTDALKANPKHQFPPIRLVRAQGKPYKFLNLDGIHRTQAYTNAKRETIPAIVERLPESRWFARAVELNVCNARAFNTQDKAFIAARLDRDGWSEQEQAKLLHMPLESLQRIKVGRLVHVETQTGKNKGKPAPADPIVLKAPARGLVGKSAELAKEKQGPLACANVASILDQFIAVLELGLVTMTDAELATRVEKIKRLLSEL